MARYPQPSVTVPASMLLKRARTATKGLAQAQLAQTAGISPAALNRYENGLREPSFAEMQRLVGHTNFRLVPTLRNEPRTRGITDLVLPDPFPYAPADISLAARLPAELVARDGCLPGDDTDGPQLHEALLHLYAIQDLARETRRVAARLQQAWSEEHEKQSAMEERYRDLIHQLEPVGYGADQASTVLARLIDDAHVVERPGRLRARSAPEPERIGTRAWAHIVCCLRAEAALCAERAALLRAALRAAERHQAANTRLEEAQERARTSPNDTQAGDVETAREERQATYQDCQDLCWGGVGGVRHIGQAGERYIAVELDHLTHRARALFAELATTPAFTAWRARHATVDPLYDLWLDGPLNSRHAPPAFYTDEDAFYAAWEHRDLAAAREELLDHDPHRALGSVEGTFSDPSGGLWTVGIEVPSATVLNHNWTEPTAVVTARHRGRQGSKSAGAVYVLARGVDARQAGALMDQLRQEQPQTGIAEVADRLTTLSTPPRDGKLQSQTPSGTVSS